MKCGVFIFTALAALATTSAHAEDLNDPGSWAYEGCKQGLLARVQRDHPQVQAIDIDGHVSEEKIDDRKSTLTGEAHFPKDGDNYHLTFECTVDRDAKQVLEVKYDKK